MSRIEAHREQLPGVSVESTQRTYLQGTLASHVLGYIGEVSQTELDAQVSDESGDEAQVTYKMGDYVGKVGLEKFYDQILRGTDGYRQVEVNAAGRPVSDVKLWSRKPETVWV